MNDQLLYSNKKNNPFHHVDIPPRKLIFSRRSNSDMFSDSPKFSPLEETHFLKFLPCNKIGFGEGDSDGENNDDPYSSDHFRMFEFKVRRCTRSRSHDWTDCPFAHPGEKARRRDPRRFHYSGTVCPEFRQGGCSRGDNCEFAHGVFECWLHPARYRTEACKDGKNCKRKVCFFAHTPQQLRILPPTNSTAAEISPVSSSSEKKIRNLLLNSPNSSTNNHCCFYCHSVTSSPTSTLMGMPHFSPPNSPSPPLSPLSRRYSVSKLSPVCDLKKYNADKDVINELRNSMETMTVNNNNHECRSCSSSHGNKLWVDVVNDVNEDDDDHLLHHLHHNQQQFVLSPSNNNCYSNYPSGFRKDCSRIDEKIEKQQEMNENGWSCPDLGWVNDLLM